MFKETLRYLKECFSGIDYKARSEQLNKENYYESCEELIKAVDSVLSSQSKLDYSRRKLAFFTLLINKDEENYIKFIDSLSIKPSDFERKGIGLPE